MGKLTKPQLEEEMAKPLDLKPASTRPFLVAAIDIANLVEEKQLAYGDSFGKSGKIMTILYPNGISVDQMDDALTVVRVLDKLFRIATKKTAFGESPWRDIMGYALLATVRDGQKLSTGT